MNRRYLIGALALALPLVVGAHGGEDHGDAPAALPLAAAAPRFSTDTDQFELVGVLEGRVLKVYLDQFGSNTPVPKAQIELDSGSWKGVATEVAPAVYVVPAEALAQPGKHPLAITVQAGEDADLLNATLAMGAAPVGAAPASYLSKLAAWWKSTPKASAAVAAAVEVASAQRLPDGSLFVPKAVQRQLGLRTVQASVGAQAATVELNGRVLADPNSGGRVQASQPGRIEAGPKGLPVLGQKVRKGEVLLWLRPVMGSVERGNQRAALAELDAQLTVAERKVARYAQLDGSLAQKDIDAAQFELRALKQRRAAVGASLGDAEALVAPVSGVISATSVVNGQVVEARELLLEIIDPARLSVEALAYDAALVDGLTSASVPLPGGALALQFVGGGKQLREQALPLLFRVKSQNAPVAVGQPVKVIAKTTRTLQGVALPHAALARNSAGDSVVWVHIGAERFAPRKVTSQPLDAGSVAVTQGLAAGERVVSVGASLLAQVR